MNAFHLTGLIAAPFTPFTMQEGVDLKRIPEYAAYLQEAGVSGVFVNGTTGEFASLTLKERQQLTQAWCAARGSLQVVIHCGHSCLKDACELARCAESEGADAIAALSPYFYKPDSPRTLIDWCRALAGTTPALPFYYYHIPSKSGFLNPVSSFLETMAAEIPNFAGVKYTHEDALDFGQCMDLATEKDMLWGRDEMLLAALALGARGAVGSTYNFAAPLYLKMWEAFDAGDMETARNCQQESRKIIADLLKGCFLLNAKSALRDKGIDCGGCRKPFPTA